MKLLVYFPTRNTILLVFIIHVSLTSSNKQHFTYHSTTGCEIPIFYSIDCVPTIINVILTMYSLKFIIVIKVCE